MKGKENSVTQVRKIRDRLSRKVKEMTYEEQKDFLKKAKGGVKKPLSSGKLNLG